MILLYIIYIISQAKAACEEISYHEKASAETPNRTNRLLGTLDNFFLLATISGMWSLTSLTRDQTLTLGSVQSSNHWTDSEFPAIIMTGYRTCTQNIKY